MNVNSFAIFLFAVGLFVLLISFDSGENFGYFGPPPQSKSAYLTKEANQEVEEHFLRSSFSDELIGVRFNRDDLYAKLNAFMTTYEENHSDDFGEWEIFPKLIRYNTDDTSVVKYLSSNLCVEEDGTRKCKIHICEDQDGEVVCHYQLVSQGEMLEHYKDKYSIAIQLLKGGVKLVESEVDDHGFVYYPNVNLAELCPNNCP